MGFWSLPTIGSAPVPLPLCPGARWRQHPSAPCCSACGQRLWFLGAVLFNLQIIESVQKRLPKVPWLMFFQESDQTILLVLNGP